MKRSHRLQERGVPEERSRTSCAPAKSPAFNCRSQDGRGTRGARSRFWREGSSARMAQVGEWMPTAYTFLASCKANDFLSRRFKAKLELLPLAFAPSVTIESWKTTKRDPIGANLIKVLRACSSSTLMWLGCLKRYALRVRHGRASANCVDHRWLTNR